MTYVDLEDINFFPVHFTVRERADGDRNEIGMGDLGLAFSARGPPKKTAEGQKGGQKVANLILQELP